MKIMRQVAAGQQPSMPDWDDWETLFKDGLKLLGVRLIYILPLLLVLMPIFLLVMFGPIFGAATESESMFVLTTFVIFPLSMLCLMPIFIFVGIFIPVPKCTSPSKTNSAPGSASANAGQSFAQISADSCWLTFLSMPSQCCFHSPSRYSYSPSSCSACCQLSFRSSQCILCCFNTP
jgi:hypothetical protein